MAEKDKNEDSKPKPGDMLPADQAQGVKDQEKAASDAAFGGSEAVEQNGQMTATEHPGVPTILSHIAAVDKDDIHSDKSYDGGDELLHTIAKHIMSTTNDVVLHAQLKAHLDSRGVPVVTDGEPVVEEKKK